MRTDEHHIAKHNKILGIKDDDIQLVFLGDSLTRRWEDYIDIWTKYFATYHPANLGVGGDYLENIKWRVLHGELEGLHPKVILLLAGTNNLDKDTEAMIVNGIKEIVEIIQGKLVNAKVVVLGLFPRNSAEAGINYGQKIIDINQQLAAEYVDTEVIFKDIGAMLTNEQGNVNTEIMPDGLHLNGKGYELIGPKLKEIIEEVW